MNTTDGATRLTVTEWVIVICVATTHVPLSILGLFYLAERLL